MTQSIAEYTYEPNQVVIGQTPCYFPPYRTMPSLIEGTGRSISICFSKQDGRPIVGIDVASPQKWYEEMKTWLGYSAGGGTNGTTLQTSHKKTPAVNEGPATAVWLAGSGTNGGIFYRPKGNTRWSLATVAYFGLADDGGSSDPRRSGHKLIEFDGISDYCFVACQKASDNSNGILRSSNKGASWSEWVWTGNRNYTSLVRSKLYDHLFAAADGRGTAGTDGVWRISNLQGTASLDRMDNAGTGNPGGLLDVRCLDNVQVGDKELIAVVVGNKAGSDSKRGLWTCMVTPTYSGGGGTTPTNIPPPRHVTTKEEGAARILGYIYGDGNPDQGGSTLIGGVQMQTIVPDGPLKDECVRIANSVMGWTQGTDWKYFGTKNTFVVSKQSLVTALNTGGVSAHSGSDDFYHHALTDHAATRKQGQAYLASIVETESVKNTSPPKLMDDNRGGVYDQRIDRLAQMYSTGVNNIGAFRSGINVLCDNSKLIAYPIPLIQYPGRYPGTALADWPEGTGGTGGGTGTITGYTYSWAHVYTPGTTDRCQWVELVRLSANADTTHTTAFVGLFDANTVSTGRFPMSPSAGGGTDPYYKSLVRLQNIDTGTATEEVLTTDVNVDIRTWGQTKYDHVISFTGEAVSERSRLGASAYQGQDGAITDDGTMLVLAGKYIPWICPNPLAPLNQVRLYPLAHGMGALDGIYDVYQAPGTDQVWIPDDDRGGYAFLGRAEPHPTWVLADDVFGFSGTSQRMNGIAPSIANPGSLLTPKDSGEGYRIDTPWATHGSVTNTGGATSAKGLGYFEFTDAAGPTTYRILVGSDGIWRNGTKKVTFSSAGTRIDWASSGNTVWVMVPDLGIYRSTDSANTWTLWWSKTMNSLQSRWYGHLDNDPNSPNTLYVTFETATAVWKVPTAHTAPAGTGITPADQRITVAGTATAVTTNYEGGVQLNFARAGYITRIRYQRNTTTSSLPAADTLTLNIWNDTTHALLATVNATDVGVGYFEVALPTPLAVVTGQNYTFSIGAAGGGYMPRFFGFQQTVTNTTDCTFVSYRRNASTSGAWPDIAGAVNESFYVEPVFVANADTSPPIGSWKISGGSLAATAVCGGVAFDRYLGDLWTIDQPVNATSAAKWQILRKTLVASSTFNWESYSDPDMDENCGIMKKFRVHDGEVIGGAAGYGCVRRCN